jgi:hypothetical protein
MGYERFDYLLIRISSKGSAIQLPEDTTTDHRAPINFKVSLEGGWLVATNLVCVINEIFES